MNTRFEYMYRDAGNFKWFETVVISGFLSAGQLQPYLRDRQFFIPSKVGLKDLQPQEWTKDDHIWHEIVSMEQTSELPTMAADANKLVLRFKQARANDWYEFSNKGEDWFV